MSATSTEWQKSACIICSLNCGLEVQTEAGHITKVRGDKAHPTSQGYLCEKAQRLDYYQNGADRIDSPKRRKADGTYEDIDWPTAIREIAQKLTAIKTGHGGESIFYYGGASQGNHLGGTYAESTLKALGIVYRSNALAQEKTGEGWMQGKMVPLGLVPVLASLHGFQAVVAVCFRTLSSPRSFSPEGVEGNLRFRP